MGVVDVVDCGRSGEEAKSDRDREAVGLTCAVWNHHYTGMCTCGVTIGYVYSGVTIGYVYSGVTIGYVYSGVTIGVCV